MSDQLTMELPLGALLVTSFTCFGVISLWAATSPRHWFIRTAVVLSALSPFLLIPAYEPIVAFGLQAIVVASGNYIYRRSAARSAARAQLDPFADSNSQTGLRFSLSSLLLAMIVVAVAVPVVIKFPRLNPEGWTSVVAIGLACGVVTLIAAWMVSSRRKWLVCPIGLILCAGLSAVVWGLDWFTYSMIKFGSWPPTGPPQTVNTLMGGSEPPVLIWFAVLPAIIAMLISSMLLWIVAFPAATKAVERTLHPQRAVRLVAEITLATCILLLAAFPISIMWKLMNPLPVPASQLPSPNGYDDFVTAGATILGGSAILNTIVEPKSTAKLAAEVSKFSNSYDRIRVGLSRQSQVPLWPKENNWPNIAMILPDIQQMRALARALMREAELAQQQSRFRDAAMISIESMRVGNASSRGGLLVHYLVGVAIEGMGQYSMYSAISHLDDTACREAIAALEQIDLDREPLDQLFERERIYSENAFGWYGHLQILLDDISHGHPDSHRATTSATERTVAVSRLLLTEVALRRYFLQHGSYPSRLDELVPKYASAVPVDPLDPYEGPLRYKPTPEGYVLYSLSYDHDDDGGRPSPRDSGLLEDGDLRLDNWLAPYEEEPEADEPADEEIDEAAVDPMDRTEAE